jgi:hypothetical protein
MPINAELSARIYNLTINDDTAARATPDGGVEVRRTTLPRDQAFPQVVIATADKDGNVTHAPDWADHGDALNECIKFVG